MLAWIVSRACLALQVRDGEGEGRDHTAHIAPALRALSCTSGTTRLVWHGHGMPAQQRTGGRGIKNRYFASLHRLRCIVFWSSCLPPGGRRPDFCREVPLLTVLVLVRTWIVHMVQEIRTHTHTHPRGTNEPARCLVVQSRPTVKRSGQRGALPSLNLPKAGFGSFT